jgi:acyl-homoserine lactone acylase PvdQ
MTSLVQSWQRMKATNFTEFKSTLQLKGNASTNTLYADDKGNIGYWHGNFIPKRDSTYDWSQPVTGSIPATEWKGTHDTGEIVHIENPSQGWIQNCNSSPFNAAGWNTLDEKRFPAYMAPEGENFRSLRAIEILDKERSITLEKLIAIGNDHYLSIFDTLLPSLFFAHQYLSSDPLHPLLKEPVDLLRTWDKRSSVSSIATTLAILYAFELIASDKSPGAGQGDHITLTRSAINNTSPKQKMEVLNGIVSTLQSAFGSWKIPWGDINRYQRTSGDLYQTFYNDRESLPVGMAPSFLGSLPSYETVWRNNKQYGVAGNSFVAAVEFGKRLKAKSIATGGQSFDPESKHFTDQANGFIEGRFKEVHFYKEDVEKNKEKVYKPGKE